MKTRVMSKIIIQLLFKINLMNKIVKKIILSLVMTLLSFSAMSQEFRLSANLDTVTTKGYYNVQLPPEVNALSSSRELNDIRIKDSKGVDVPYFIYAENPIRTVSRFIDYQIKSNNVKDSLNIIVIDNVGRDNINHFSILANNADVYTYSTVRGSNDLSQWYIVKRRNESIYTVYDKNTQIIDIDIPDGNYQYYEIVLSNSQTSPLNVKQVGRISIGDVYGQFTKIDTKQMLRSDDMIKRLTYLNFPEMPYEYRIGKLVFHIANKNNYMRETLISDSNSKRSLSFTLASHNKNILLLDDFTISSKTEIEIENADNFPLEIDSVSVYSLNRYLCAYLEAGQEYTLLAGNDSIGKANYDIEYFKKDIPESLSTVKTNNLKITKKEVTVENLREPSIFETPAFMWSVIIIVGLFLIFICFKMISEMKKKK